MNCIKPNVKARKYRSREYKGLVIQPHPNAASVPIYGVRKPGERLFCAGPFATAQEAEKWIDEAELQAAIEHETTMNGEGARRR